MTSGPVPICTSCARLGPCADAELPGFGNCCEAFPAGIPDTIYIDGFDHRQEHPGDRGIRWVLSDEEGASDRLAAYEASQPSR